MKWTNVKQIFSRELRDQLRDRRTIFTVAIMPMLLYPLMGTAMLQVGQFMRKQPSRVWLINEQYLPQHPPILIDGAVNEAWIEPADRVMLEFRCSPTDSKDFRLIVDQYLKLSRMENGETLANQLVQMELARRKVDLAVYLSGPLDGEPLVDRELEPSAQDDRSESEVNLSGLKAPDDAPDIVRTESSRPNKAFIFVNSANDQSRSGAARVSQLLSRWEREHSRELLKRYSASESAIHGVAIEQADISDTKVAKAAMWSKILPFVVVIWALTGAFYPAIDLCAGEKERGTFETLLSSPAARSEIALGKLLTVMSFSYATSLLNLFSMAFTGIFVASKLTAGLAGVPIGFPSLGSFGWLMIALIPISALFSAIALATAAFARSSKEGQYYLVPLIMVSLPLMMIPVLPASKLDIGTSFIPVTGLIMLLRSLIEGHSMNVLPFVAPVCVVTFACCWFAVKWVIYQFNSESILFRPSEQFGLQVWFKSLRRDRELLPTFGQAILCGVTILVCKFFVGFAGFMPRGFSDFAVQAVITLVASILIPVVLMALVLTRNVRQSLRLNPCSLPMASAAILAAIFLNPLFAWLSKWVIEIYPPTSSLMAFEQLASKIFADSPGLWATLLVFALAPAVIEELGFRGFILSGLESLKSKWQAILLASLLFGITHSVIHQTVVTFFVGIVLGIIAVQTRSVVPCILFHAVHNSMAVLLGHLNTGVVENSFLLRRVFDSVEGGGYQYNVSAGILMGLIGLALMVWFWELPKMEKRQTTHVPNRNDLSSLACTAD